MKLRVRERSAPGRSQVVVSLKLVADIVCHRAEQYHVPMTGAERVRDLGGTAYESFDYWHGPAGERAVLADIAQLLLSEEIVVIPSCDVGVSILDDAFGPELATVLVKTRRIVLPIDATGTWSRRAYDRLHYRIKGWFPGEKPRPADDAAARDAFHDALLDYAVREVDHAEVNAVEARTNAIFATWQHEFGVQGIITAARYLHGVPNVMRMKDITHDEACLETAKRIARLLALGWTSGAVKSALASDTRHFLLSLSHKPARNHTADQITKLLSYHHLPDIQSCVLEERWGPAEVVAAVTSDGAARLRDWIREHEQSGGGDIVAAYQKAERQLPRIELWRKSLRFGATTALSIGLAKLLGSDSALAAALGVTTGAIDQFFGDRWFAPWHPRLWLGEFAITAKSREQN